jgi:dTMP kinase
VTSGRFITLEGIEGAGKSTVAPYLREWLGDRGIVVTLTREPGGTPLGERIREVVLRNTGETVPPVAETLLMFAARAAHVETVIVPALQRGDWVVCDRFTDASRAYQGAGRGVAPSCIEALAKMVHPGLTPDCTLVLDLPVGVGMARARGRSFPGDRFEAEAEAFFERVRAEYLAIAAREPARVKVIDAARSLEDVQAQVTAAVAPLLDAG